MSLLLLLLLLMPLVSLVSLAWCWRWVMLSEQQQQQQQSCWWRCEPQAWLQFFLCSSVHCHCLWLSRWWVQWQIR